jgi:hypothetical protein
MTTTRKQDSRVARARAYARLARKAEIAGQWTLVAHYRAISQRLYNEARREREYRAARKG